VTNCVTIGFFSGGASLPLGSSRRFTMVVVCRLRLRVPRLGDDRDAKLATLIHLASPRNQQVRALNVHEGQREMTALPWWIPRLRVAMCRLP
jgi:hypothetical protein